MGVHYVRYFRYMHSACLLWGRDIKILSFFYYLKYVVICNESWRNDKNLECNHCRAAPRFTTCLRHHHHPWRMLRAKRFSMHAVPHSRRR